MFQRKLFNDVKEITNFNEIKGKEIQKIGKEPEGRERK